MRRSVAQEMARIFSDVDLLLVPSLRDEMLTISNFTGHPSLTFAPALSRCPRRAATGLRIPPTRFRGSRRRAAFRMALRWSVVCSMREHWVRWGWHWNGYFRSPASVRPVSDPTDVPVMHLLWLGAYSSARQMSPTSPVWP